MSLLDVINEMDDAIEAEELTVGDMVDALEHRGFGPLLVTASLIGILPTSLIPGVPSLVGIVVIAIAGQLLFGKPSPWLPKALRERAVPAEKFRRGKRLAEPYLKRIDRALKPRFHWLVGGIGTRCVALWVILIAALFPPLELIPFAALLPALAIGLIGVGLSAKDGVVMTLGIVLSGAAFAVGLNAFA